MPATPTKQTTPTIIPDSPDTANTADDRSSQGQDEFDQLVMAMEFSAAPIQSSAVGGTVSSAGAAAAAAAAAVCGSSSTATVTCGSGMGPRSMAAPYSKDNRYSGNL